MTKKKGKKGLYPRFSLIESLQVAQAIQSNNAGQPYAVLDLANALGRTPGSSAFRGLITASGQFGLTKGSFGASNISLTERGRSIVASKSENEKKSALREALLSIDTFKTFLDKFNRQKCPNYENVKNTLAKDFNISENQVKPCFEMTMKNLEELEILDNISGSLYIRLDKLDVTSPQLISTDEEKEIEDMEESGDLKDDIKIEKTPSEKAILPKKNQIFVVHGKNRKPLEQLKKILDGFKVPYSVAIDEPHGGRPISQKVSDLMGECTSAIVIFTADEKYQDSEGNEYYRPSDNTVYELGAAGVIYGNKIMILKEDGVSLASDFSDLGHIKFEKDKLTAKAMELVKELINLDLVEITAK